MRGKNKCSTPYCRNNKVKGKRVCHKCKSKRFKKLNPIGYFYNIAKQNAKKRGIEWELTRAEYEKFCFDNNYIELKGKTSKSMTMDRKDHTKGYTYNNIQPLSLGENSIKGNQEKLDNVPF